MCSTMHSLEGWHCFRPENLLHLVCTKRFVCLQLTKEQARRLVVTRGLAQSMDMIDATLPAEKVTTMLKICEGYTLQTW